MVKQKREESLVYCLATSIRSSKCSIKQATIIIATSHII